MTSRASAVIADEATKFAVGRSVDLVAATCAREVVKTAMRDASP